MSRIKEILREYVAFVEQSEETRREIVRRLEEAVLEEVGPTYQGRGDE